MLLSNLFPKFFVQAKPYNFKSSPKTDSFLAWFWYFVEPKWIFIYSSIQRLVIVAIWSTAPLLLKYIIDAVNQQPIEIAKQQVIFYLLIYLAAVLFSFVLQLMQYVVFNFFELSTRQFSFYCFKHIVSLPLSWHEGEGTGSKLQRIVTARNAFFDLFLMYFFQVLDFIGQTLFVLGAMIILGVPLIYSLYTVGFIVFYIGLVVLMGKKEGRYSDQLAQHFEITLGKIYEFASSIMTTKALSLLPFIEKKAWKEEMKAQNLTHTFNIHIRVKWFVLNVFRDSSVVVLGFILLVSLYNSAITVGEFVMIFMFFTSATQTIIGFGEVSEQFLQKRAQFMRVIKNLREKKEELDFQPVKVFPKKWSNIIFDNVELSYKENKALSKLNLVIPQGQKVALVGRSGAGKTTFMKLLLKLMNPSSGSIYFDDVDMKNIQKSEISKNISVVLQDTELFNISIKDNVFIQGKGKKSLEAYLKMAYADTFVSQLPKKANTVIGERGVKLSGGEKQRIGIARALAQESDIVVFDEATSALDTESEKAIQKAMHAMFQNKTAFIIAHRLSTIKEVDRILVFDKGRIVEDGSFEELLKKNKIFARLWRLQKLD